ncbi:MAG: glycoside hydrolase family 27 protein [Ruminococcaceae bacterium]|nr:glycoside hydrolase family 27 protein [Oscillospiraceae bacterium]
MTAKTSPMGWNSWDCWGAAVTEDIVRQNADYMAKHLKEFGWEYVVVDIQWYEPAADSHSYHPFTDLDMDEYSRLYPAVNRFPSAAGGKGFAPLAEYVHSLGLKFGIHIMRGIPRQAVHRNAKILGTDRTARQIADPSSICMWNSDMYGVDPKKPGAKEYYDSLMALYASWGVDFIKCDDIAREMPRCEGELRLLSEAVRNCGREIVLSLSPGPALPERAELYKETAEMWRITDDFWDDWRLLYDMFSRAQTWCIHSGAGNWPDADMLPVGPIRQVYGRENRTRFTEDEQRTMMTLWSVFRSPLMIGGDMPGFDDFTLALLTNRNILDMHKNARGAHPVWRRKRGDAEWILWTAENAAGGHYLALFNAGEEDGEITVSLSDAELDGTYTLREMWTGALTGPADSVTVFLPKHAAAAWTVE